MSIVALKRNSRRFKARVSGQGSKGFSLSGGHRNQGWVGQGVRGRSLTGTPFRGAVPMGNGGCCGTYVKKINNRSSNCCTNDPNIVKRSTMNTLGHIDSSFIHPTSVLSQSCNTGLCPSIPTWVKDFSPLNHSEGQRIFNVARENGKCVNLKDDAGLDTCHKGCKSASYHIGGKKVVREMYSKNLNMLAVGSEEYQRTSLMSTVNLPTPDCKKPYPMELNHTGSCQKNFMTSDDAIKGGMLPKDWMNCDKCANPGMSYITHLDSQNISTQTSAQDYTDVQRKRLDGQLLLSKTNLSEKVTQFTDGIHIVKLSKKTNLKEVFEIEVSNFGKTALFTVRGEYITILYDPVNKLYTDGKYTLSVSEYNTELHTSTGNLGFYYQQDYHKSQYTTYKLASIDKKKGLTVQRSVSADHTNISASDLSKDWTIWGGAAGAGDDDVLGVDLNNGGTTVYNTFTFNKVKYKKIYIGSNGNILFNGAFNNWYVYTSDLLQYGVGVVVPWIDMNTRQIEDYPDKYISYSQKNDTFRIKYDTSQYAKDNVIEILVILYLDTHHRAGDIEIHFQQAVFLLPYIGWPLGFPLGISYGSVNNIPYHTESDLTPFIDFLKTNEIGASVTTESGILLDELLPNTLPVDFNDVCFRISNRD